MKSKIFDTINVDYRKQIIDTVKSNNLDSNICVSELDYLFFTKCMCIELFELNSSLEQRQHILTKIHAEKLIELLNLILTNRIELKIDYINQLLSITKNHLFKCPNEIRVLVDRIILNISIINDWDSNFQVVFKKDNLETPDDVDINIKSYYTYT